MPQRTSSSFVKTRFLWLSIVVRDKLGIYLRRMGFGTFRLPGEMKTLRLSLIIEICKLTKFTKRYSLRFIVQSQCLFILLKGWIDLRLCWLLTSWWNLNGLYLKLWSLWKAERETYQSDPHLFTNFKNLRKDWIRKGKDQKLKIGKLYMTRERLCQ